MRFRGPNDGRRRTGQIGPRNDTESVRPTPLVVLRLIDRKADILSVPSM